MMGIVAEESCETAVSLPMDDLSLYLRDIRCFPVLDEQEEKELALQCARGDADAIRLLVCSNLRLVVSVARDYAGRGVPLMDLVQEGSIGLLTAAKKYDPELGFRFSTYATKWIRRGVLRYLAENGTLIRIPGYTSEKLQKVLRVRAELTQHLGEEPSIEILSDALGVETDQLQELMQWMHQVESLNAPVGDNASLQDLLEDNFSSLPQEQLVREEMSRVMELLLEKLTERQRLILRLHFGMEDGKCHSHESIGQRLGLSKQRVQQIEQQAMEQLKKNGVAFGLEDFLDE